MTATAVAILDNELRLQLCDTPAAVLNIVGASLANCLLHVCLYSCCLANTGNTSVAKLCVGIDKSNFVIAHFKSRGSPFAPETSVAVDVGCVKRAVLFGFIY